MKVDTALVVDDSKVVQAKLRRMLEARGLEVEVAGSGHESLDYLKSNLPDVIFMDFMMDDMDGYEVTGMIKANPKTSAIPVIICTGHDTPQDRERARNSRASGFVTKPVDDATLDTLLVQLRQGVAAIAPVAASHRARCRRWPPTHRWPPRRRSLPPPRSAYRKSPQPSASLVSLSAVRAKSWKDS